MVDESKERAEWKKKKKCNHNNDIRNKATCGSALENRYWTLSISVLYSVCLENRETLMKKWKMHGAQQMINGIKLNSMKITLTYQISAVTLFVDLYPFDFVSSIRWREHLLWLRWISGNIFSINIIIRIFVHKKTRLLVIDLTLFSVSVVRYSVKEKNISSKINGRISIIA